ncbi:MAG: hypothetical protein C0456_05355 [Hyphomonas sp.]|uniref:hypothetical protein n=1 Tax=Hyphomonas sp. TaxID=87 RepID=UPI001D74B63C|nr:hypothetical protein [Hyphomonas sp.]MBA4226042.1 hypothetical protein [Hyphomonas sp.]
MKPLTAALLFSFALAGTACSDPAKSSAEATPAAPVEGETLPIDTATASAGSELSGTLNLNIGQPQDSGTRLLGSGGLGGSGQGSTVLGAGGLGGGNFGESLDLGINLDELADPSAPLADPTLPIKPSDEDEIVRLPN